MELHLQDVYFKGIQSGAKKIEGRLAKEKYRLLKVGENIVFINDAEEKISKTIESIHIFGSFREAFSTMDFREAVPDVDNIENAVTIYASFYSLEDQEKYNVIFLKLN